MNWEALLDPALSSRMSLTLVHSLWQMALLAAIVWSCERLFRWSAEQRCAMHVAAMIVGLALLPVTFVTVDVGTPPIAPTVVEQAGEDVPHRVSHVPINDAIPLPADVEVAPSTSGPAKPQTFGDAELSTRPPDIAPAATRSDAPAWTSLAPWVTACYAVGVSLMFLRLCFGVWSAHRLVARSRPVTDSAIVTNLEHLATRLSLRTRPVIAYSEHVVIPKIVGLLRPAVLLPSSAMTGLSPEQLEMVLAHELTHLRRHDLWVNLLQRVAEAVLFFNPCLWYLTRRINVLREYACDEAVCRMTTDQSQDVRSEYATALLRIAELSRAGAPSGRRRPATDAAELTTLAASGRSPSQLRRRIARLVGEPLREPLHLSRGSLLTLLTVALAVILSSSLWPVVAQTDETDAEEQQNETKTDDAEPQNADDDRVEVIAIGTHNEQPQRWWDASGKIIETPSFEWKEGHDVSGDDRQWRRVVIRVHDLAAGEEVSWEISGRPDSWGAEVTVDGETNPRGYFTQQFVVPEGQNDLRLRVGIASGDWKSIARLGTSDTITDMNLPEPGTGFFSTVPCFISSVTFQEDGGTTVFATHNVFEHNFRVIAVDKDGKTHDSGSRGGRSMGTMVYQSRVKFPDLPVDQIDHFEFQTRPYEWTEIADLPLEPRADINAAIEKPDESAAAEPDESVIEFPVVVAEHVLLLDGREVISWDELEAKIAVLPDPSRAHPHFYITRGAREAGLEEPAKERIRRLHKDYKLSGHSEGSLWPRSDLRYDRITGNEDLVPDESLRVEGRVVYRGEPVKGVEVILITPIDESIFYKSYHIALVDGRVRNRLEHVMSVTDQEGRFAFYPPEDTPYTLVALHPDKGFALTGGDQHSDGEGVVELLQWASVVTSLTEDEQSPEVDLSTRLQETDERPEIVINQYWSDRSDHNADAREFRFPHVPPIVRTSVTRSFADKEGTSFSVPDVSVSLQPGESRQLPLGPMSEKQREWLELMSERSWNELTTTMPRDL